VTEDKRVIEIRDSEINVEEIMNRIRERIRQRRAQASAQGLDYDRLVDARAPIVATGQSDADLNYDLRQLQTNADAIPVSLAMRDRHIPLLNFLIYRLEMLLHRLVLKYVNMLAGRQVVFNTAASNVLSALAQRLEQSEARAQQLEKEVSALRERVAELEQTRNTG
jgi:phage shock protein A